jgi:complex III assembly factor LYRM7
MPTLLAARYEARNNFEANRGLTTESDALSKQIAHAEEVAKFLRENIVQGQADETGNYSMSERTTTASGALFANGT